MTKIEREFIQALIEQIVGSPHEVLGNTDGLSTLKDGWMKCAFYVRNQLLLLTTSKQSEVQKITAQMTPSPTPMSPDDIVQYVLKDLDGPGWVTENPIEGWHFTTLPESAARFSSLEEARKVERKHFPTSNLKPMILQSGVKEGLTEDRPQSLDIPNDGREP